MPKTKNEPTEDNDQVLAEIEGLNKEMEALFEGKDFPTVMACLIHQMANTIVIASTTETPQVPGGMVSLYHISEGLALTSRRLSPAVHAAVRDAEKSGKVVVVNPPHGDEEDEDSENVKKAKKKATKAMAETLNEAMREAMREAGVDMDVRVMSTDQLREFLRGKEG